MSLTSFCPGLPKYGELFLALALTGLSIILFASVRVLIDSRLLKYEYNNKVRPILR